MSEMGAFFLKKKVDFVFQQCPKYEKCPQIRKPKIQAIPN